MRTGQQGILMWDKKTGYKIGIDLFLSEEPGRQVSNVVNPEDLTDVSLIFGTHDHLDHIDRETWKKIAKVNSKVRFVAPKFFEKTLPGELEIEKERFIFVDEGQTVKIGINGEVKVKRGVSRTKFQLDKDAVHIKAVAAAHEFLDTTPEGLHPYLMYIVTIGGKKICHMGDTCLYEGIYDKLRKLGPFDLMFPPINGRDARRYSENCIGNMTFQEAADLVGVLKPELAIPGHYDMFAMNCANPKDFTEYVEIKYPGQKVMIAQPGEVVEVQ